MAPFTSPALVTCGLQHWFLKFYCLDPAHISALMLAWGLPTSVCWLSLRAREEARHQNSGNKKRKESYIRYLCFCRSGRSVLPAGCAQQCQPGQFQGLGLRRGGVARSGPLRPVAHHEPGGALHRPPARRHHRQDPSPARHQRDLLHREQLVQLQPISRLSSDLLFFSILVPVCLTAR